MDREWRRGSRHGRLHHRKSARRHLYALTTDTPYSVRCRSVDYGHQLAEFESERRRIADMENADSAAHRPERKGRSHLDRRTATALAAGSCFVIGFIFCFVMLARN
jgi:hypothetical protein